jgi:ATP-dependent protease ClpP protease subunit/phage major head subunit gpT-like protein
MLTPWYSIRARAPRAAEVFIYGDIGESWSEESVTAAAFVREISALDVDTLTVRLNSYGGSVADGLAMYNALKRHKASVTVAIDGIAASIASLVAMAGDTVEMAENALLMVHAPWGVAAGNAAAMREFADTLDIWAQAMATSYAAKTGRPLEEMLALLTDGADHWLDAEQARTEGFIDNIVAAVPMAASFDLSRFKLPAAMAAHFQGETMDTAEIEARGREAEARRRKEIAEAFGRFAKREGVPALLASCQDDMNCTPQAAREKLLAHLAQGAEPLGGHYVARPASMEHESPESRRALMAEALAHRMGGPAPREGNPYRHATFADAAREVLAHRGVSTRELSRSQIVRAALTHTTSDFAILLQDTTNRTLRQAYSAAPSGIMRIARKATAPDFRAKYRVQLGEWPELLEVPEGAEFKAGSIASSQETYRLRTYGRTFGITRQALVNDDLGAFADMVRAFGRSAAELQAKVLVDLLTAATGVGPTMSDTKALFHTDHGNLAGSGAALDVTSLGAARAAMRLQKGLDGATPINAEPRFILVPAALETKAEQVVASISAATAADVNPFSGRLEVVVDPRLDGAYANSAKAWYVFADPATLDTIEYAYLDGDEGPVVEAEPGFRIDGVEIKCRLDFGAGVLDWRGAYRNPGA